MKPIKLNLEKHCIETETKRIYNRLISNYFKATDNIHLEKQIDFLHKALTNLDFTTLRGQFSQLSKNDENSVTYETDNSNKIIIKVDGITLFTKQI